MTAPLIILAIAAWAACGWVAYRNWMSALQRGYREIAAHTYPGDLRAAWVAAAFGPIALLLMTRTLREYGIRYVPPPGQRDEETF